jgi:hypothetical protein
MGHNNRIQDVGVSCGRDHHHGNANGDHRPQGAYDVPHNSPGPGDAVGRANTLTEINTCQKSALCADTGQVRVGSTSGT